MARSLGAAQLLQLRLWDSDGVVTWVDQPSLCPPLNTLTPTHTPLPSSPCRSLLKTRSPHTALSVPGRRQAVWLLPNECFAAFQLRKL